MPDNVLVSHSFWIPIPYPRTGLYSSYHEKFGFTNWWLKKKYFTPEYDNTNYKPFFKRHMFFLDHPQLKTNFYKYGFFYKLFIKKIFIKVWFLQAKRRFGWNKRYLIFFLSLFSYSLYFISPKVEKFIIEGILTSRLSQLLRIFFRIEKQSSIGHFKARKEAKS